jgi:hypothetical protein
MGYNSLARKLDSIMKSKQIKDAALKLVTCKKDSQPFRDAYAQMGNALEKIEEIDDLNFNLIRSDGKFVYSSENTVEQIIANKELRNGNLEVQQAMDFHHNRPLGDKQRFRPSVNSLMAKGYGVARRVGSVSGNLENYVAFTFTPNGNKLPSEKTCTFRLSQKVYSINYQKI